MSQMMVKKETTKRRRSSVSPADAMAVSALRLMYASLVEPAQDCLMADYGIKWRNLSKSLLRNSWLASYKLCSSLGNSPICSKA
jgi:hypothetical protein